MELCFWPVTRLNVTRPPLCYITVCYVAVDAPFESCSEPISSLVVVVLMCHFHNEGCAGWGTGIRGLM